MTPRDIAIVSDNPILVQGFCHSLFTFWVEQGIRLHFFFPSLTGDWDRSTIMALGQIKTIYDWKPEAYEHSSKQARRSFQSALAKKDCDLVLTFGLQANEIMGRSSTAKTMPWIAQVCGRAGFPSFQGIKGRLAANRFRKAYQFADQVICFNREDALLMDRNKLVDRNALKVVPGAGIDCSESQATERIPNGQIVFLMAGRLCPEKGVREYAEAAHRMRSRFPDAIFQLQGPVEVPKSDPQTVLNRWDPNQALQYLDHQTDYRKAIQQADIFVFPSYNGEGMPASLLEALAQGKPLITTDHPGCKDTVDIDKNGALVPVKDIDALHAAMERLMHIGPAARKAMSLHSRQKAKAEFSIAGVISIYQQILNGFPQRETVNDNQMAGKSASPGQLQTGLQV
ncbi:MAG: glycosyltransferase [Bacteroidota bacterium]